MDGLRQLALIAIAGSGLLFAGCLSLREETVVRSPPRPTATVTRPATATPVPGSFEPGPILGLRCSVASKFLRETYDLTPGKGCVVLRVNDGGGAQHAGMRIGDRITAIDGVPITSGRQLTFMLPYLPDRDVHEIVVDRGSETLTLDVTFGSRADRPEDDPYYYYLRAKSEEGEDWIADYTRAIQLEPAFDLAYLYRGDANVRLAFMFGDGLDDAVADFARALDLDPELAEAHRLLASVLMFANDDFAGALDHAERAIELDGCLAPVAPWDVDCAEAFALRAEIYLGRLDPGDDARIEADIDAIAAVELLAPSTAKLRWELAYLHGDDAAARAAGEAFVSMFLFPPNEHHEQRQLYVRRILEESAAVLDYSVNWFYVQHLTAPNAEIYGTSPGDPLVAGPGSTFTPHAPGRSESVLAYQIDAPGVAPDTLVSWELLRNGLRLASSVEENRHGERFQIYFGARRQLPPGPYALRVYANGELVATETVTVP